MENLNDKRIAVLLSGGVDSAVVVYELVRQGLKPDCFYIKIGPEEQEEWDCSSEEDMEMASAVAARYGLRLEVVDCHKEYWNQVTRYTMDKVRAGFTPNPAVMCNRLIKFGAFDEKAGHAYDLIATGHYAQTELADGHKWLTTSPDPVKDQTDFLAQIEQWQLRKALFPIGHYEKHEVREIAQREHLINARRKDSQGICFLGKIDYNEYVRRYLGEKPGPIVELESGKTIGEHRGLWFHTIGQRKGLRLGGGPWFVIKKDMVANILYVSHGYDPDNAYQQHFMIHDLHWLTLSPTAALQALSPDEALAALPDAAGWKAVDGSLLYNITFKIRHTPYYYPAILEMLPPQQGAAQASEAIIHSANRIHGVAPGQFCVVYDDRHHRCFGSAEITL